MRCVPASRLVSSHHMRPSARQNSPIRGFPDDAVAAQRQREQQFRKIPDAARLKEYMEAMAGEPHVAGQPSSKKVADYALAKFKSFGLDAKLEEFEAMMPWPIETTVEVVAPEKYVLRVKEPVLPEDPDSGDQTPLYNAYSARWRRHRRSGLRELRHAGRLRSAEGARRRRQGQDRHRALRRRLARHQAEGRLRARRDRLLDLFGSAGRRLLRRRCVSRRTVSSRVRRAARQRDGHADPRGRSADAWLWQRTGRQEDSHRGCGNDPEDSGAADLVRRRGADPAAAQRQGGARTNGRARCRSRTTSARVRRRCT